MTTKTLAIRFATMTAVATLLVGCSGGGGIEEGVAKEGASLKGPVEGPSKEMEVLLKAKPKHQSAVKAL